VLGSVQLRAQELAARINQKFPAGEIQIIAHSMGGLDARCMLAQNMLGLAAAGRVISFTTISTPHDGSPVANLLLGEPDGLDFPFNSLLAQFASVNVHALVDLTTTGAPVSRIKTQWTEFAILRRLALALVRLYYSQPRSTFRPARGLMMVWSVSNQQLGPTNLPNRSGILITLGKSAMLSTFQI
jgi:hypothetical protein